MSDDCTAEQAAAFFGVSVEEWLDAKPYHDSLLFKRFSSDSGSWKHWSESRGTREVWITSCSGGFDMTASERRVALIAHAYAAARAIDKATPDTLAAEIERRLGCLPGFVTCGEDDVGLWIRYLDAEIYL